MPTPRIHQDQAAKQRAYRERLRRTRLHEMQQKGLPALPPIPTMPGTARWTAMLDQARATLEAARDEMQNYYDDRSEAWQESERGEMLQERVEALDALLTDLQALQP